MTQVATEFESRPRESERATRKPMSFWNRIKFLFWGGALFAFFFAAEMADDPLLPASEAFNMTARGKWWILALMGLELIRQIHYLICEHSASYYQLWRDKVFAGWNESISRFDPWKRHQAARTIKIVTVLVVLNLVLARLFDTNFFRAPYELLDFVIGVTPTALQLVLFLTFWIGFQFGLMIWFATRGGVETFYPDDINTRFSDVWGQDPVLEKVKENLIFLDNPKMIEEKGGYVPSGLLLWGPPGTGKTLMAEAMAGETGKPFVNIDASQLNTMGMGVIKVKMLFRRLRRLALRYGGVVAFFDEADALGSRGELAGQAPRAQDSLFSGMCSCGGFGYLSDVTRQHLMDGAIGAHHHHDPPTGPDTTRSRFMMGMGGGMGGSVLPVLLTELSGLNKPRGIINRYVRKLFGLKSKPPPKYRMLIMMATNMPQSLDQALLRPGRIDRIYRVGYPTNQGRVRTYEGYLAKVEHDLTAEQVDRLSHMTPYATGASIKDLVNEALINAIQDNRDMITWTDVLDAKHLKTLGLTRDQELIAVDRHGVAVHEACHAVVAYRVRKHLEIDMATIHPGTDYLGLVASVPIEDRQKLFKTEFESDIMVCLASLAGERIFFAGDSASGVSGDLEQATEIAILMEGFWGMGSTIASHAIIQRAGVGGGGPTQKPGDLNKELLSGSMGQRVEDNLNRLLRRTHTLIERERDTILRVAHALEEQKTLAGEDVVAVIEQRMGTVVDGTVYLDPEFVGEIDQYHERMLLAHQEGTQRVEFEPPERQTLRSAVEPVSANGSGNGQTPDVPVVDAENGSKQPAFVDHEGEAIIGPGTSQLLKANNGSEDDEPA
ncbi:MAG: AAA family ATPase [Acidimicrobiia bacterium]